MSRHVGPNHTMSRHSEKASVVFFLDFILPNHIRVHITDSNSKQRSDF
jgi:hypothetical protein